MTQKIFLLLISLALVACKKDEVIPEPYSKRILYHESFNSNPGWVLLPTEEFYQPDTTCIRVEDGLLKMLFDQTLDNCGCAWVGVNYTNSQSTENFFLKKIGIKVKLDAGYFQTITRYHDTVDVFGHPCQAGELVTFSNFTLDFNGLNIIFPNPYNGRFQRDSLLDLNANKLVGTEFEVIFDNGTKHFFIDGVEQPTDMIYFNWQNMSTYDLNIEFKLGHLPELSPTMDKLFVDEVEIYTWTGDR